MKGTKAQNGITLIALIITIVVLMILAVVTINSVKDGGVITHAQNAANSYKEAQIEEEVGLYSMEYYMSNKRSMQEETIDKMVEVCTETGVSPEQLTVHYNEYDKSEYVLYRIDKTTEEERTILEDNGVKALRGDIDLDGVLTQNDANLIYDYELMYTINGEEVYDENGEVKEKFELPLEIANIDGDDGVYSSDGTVIEEILSGKYENRIYTGGYME